MTKTKLILLCFLIIHSFCKAKERVISVYRDGQKESINYLDSLGVLTKQVLVNTSPPGATDTINFIYKNDSFTFIKVTGALDEEVYQKNFQDVQSDIPILKAHKVIIPYPFINANEVLYITNFFYAFKKYTEITSGDTKIISFENLNTKIRFYPSDIEGFLEPDAVIYKYELKLKANGSILQEKVVFKGGILTKKYSYLGSTLMETELVGSYKNDKKVYKTVKEFKYDN